jgi:queuine tRNA-ribosyltransferase
MLSAQLNTIHNLRYYQTLMAGLRDAIAEGELDAFTDKFYRKQAIGDKGGLNP